jgi:type IV pilus assembly protein PilM
MSFSRTLARYFPAPKLLIPSVAGVDITDGSIKWVTLVSDAYGVRIGTFGQRKLPQGVVVGGGVKDMTQLTGILREMKKELGGVTHVHAALPEEGAYVFAMHVPSQSTYEEIQHIVEFELEGRVPIPLAQAVYDFDVIEKTTEGNIEIGVSAFSRDLTEGYVSVFGASGLTLMSLEIEARSVGRAICSSGGDKPVTLLADIGSERAGIAILKRGVPIFTSTVTAGGREMTNIVMGGLNLDEKQTELFKNEQGLLATDPAVKPVRDKLEKVADALAQEIARHYQFWDTRRNEHGERVTPVGQIYLVGGSANLRGLADYIASKVHAPTERPDVWRHVASLDEYIPPIDRRTSLQYVTSVGLALRGLPHYE